MEAKVKETQEDLKNEGKYVFRLHEELYFIYFKVTYDYIFRSLRPSDSLKIWCK